MTVRPRGPSHRTIGRGTNPSPFDRLPWATTLTPVKVSSGYDLSIGGPKDEVETAEPVHSTGPELDLIAGPNPP